LVNINCTLFSNADYSSIILQRGNFTEIFNELNKKYSKYLTEKIIKSILQEFIEMINLCVKPEMGSL
jgi:hypothetical protein